MTSKFNISPDLYKCSRCQKEFGYVLKTGTYHFICPNCGTLYEGYSGILCVTDNKFKLPKNIKLPIGSKGILKNTEWVVLGIIRKQEKGTNYKWDEYTLFNPEAGYAYLSEFDGHWNLLFEEVLLNNPQKDRLKVYSKNNLNYHLFNKYVSVITHACGEFPFSINAKEEARCEEYINPPNGYFFESTDTTYTAYHAEYIKHHNLYSAFNINDYTPPVGVGMLEPYIPKLNISDLKKTTIFLIAFLGLMQIFYSYSCKNETVFEKSFSLNDSSINKEFTTSTFEIDGGTKNIEVTLSANLDNSWIYVAGTLVNAKTGDLYDFEIESEYYHGYEDGYTWTEGSQWASKVVSQIPSGTYYILLNPQKPINSVDSTFNLIVKRDVDVFSNFLIITFLLIIYPIYLGSKSNSYERKRWFNSNYSPYRYEN